MRVVIIGAVAAGTSAATEIRRRNKGAEIVVYEKDRYISYSACGMPYFISNEFTDIELLVPRDPSFFKQKHDVSILVKHDVLSIDPGSHTLQVMNMVTGKVFKDTYDKLIIATGAIAETPAIAGNHRKNVFLLRNISNMKEMKAYIDLNRPRTAVVIGSGLIGLEMCESFVKLGIRTTLLARSSLAKGLDGDLSKRIEEHLKKQGITVLTNVAISEIAERSVLLQNGKVIPADLTLLATGVRPATDLAKSAGVEIGETGAIKVNRHMMTSVEDIYSCGDCAESFHVVTGKPVYRPLGSTANKTGIIAGNHITGGKDESRGILGTSIFRIFDMTVAQTGLSEVEAQEQGFEVVVSMDARPDKPEFMGGREMAIKAVADKKSGRLLGAQIVGYEGVDRRIDVIAAVISLNGMATDLIYLDLAYAPPYSTPKDPLFFTGVKLRGLLDR